MYLLPSANVAGMITQSILRNSDENYEMCHLLTDVVCHFRVCETLGNILWVRTRLSHILESIPGKGAALIT
jgi:hypothetical protein